MCGTSFSAQALMLLIEAVTARQKWGGSATMKWGGGLLIMLTHSEYIRHRLLVFNMFFI